ncbi:unnamed protein product [Calypogeia fissa]
MKELGTLKGPGIRIELASDTPIFRRPYRYSDMERDLIRSKTLDLLEAGLVEISHGEYASATVMPVKKDIHGNYTDRRMCGDYRPINRITKSDKYAMPTPEEIFDAVGHARVFSTLDLRAGYHQLPIWRPDKVKTAFWGVNTHGKDSLYHWLFLPFGLKNAPAEFQRVMDRILAGLEFVRCYIDDILVFSSTVKEHQTHLQAVFERLRTHGLRLHPGKCKFFQEQVEYLGHVIYSGGLGVQQTKVLAITLIPRPTDVSRIRAFVGLANYYRRYVKGFSRIVKPLTSLLKVDQEWHWGEEQERAFQELKAQLTSAPILRRPIRGRPYQLHIDWSMLGLGAVLTQQDEQKKEFVVAFASRSNNAAESRYSSYEGECLAVVWAVAHFRCYLFGTPFTLVTDHQPLKWLMESSKLTGKLARWALILQEYDFQVVHRAGVANLDADGLSRNPCTSQQDVTGARWHDEVDEEMVPGWHASAFLCLLLGVGSTRGRTVASYSSQGVDVGPPYPLGDPEDGGGDTDQRDVHHDQMVLEFLRTSMVPGLASAKEKDRVFQRAKRYRLEGRHILRVWEDGRVRVIPHPSQRTRIVLHAHEELGHYGVKRTYSLLQGQYWWRGMHMDVQQLVARCMVCDRVRASFNAPTPQLHPLPIMGLGYRWSLDFAGPLPLTVRHHRYVLVMVEHFFKWIELVALPDKASEGTAYEFLDRVLSHFGAPAEVLTDQGTEFQGEFQVLCDRSLIDHRTTSRDHPEADGLAERVV